MKKIKIKKGFKKQLAGKPDLKVLNAPEPVTLAVPATDIPHIRPKLLVRENDRVMTGTPLFCDKRNPSIQYVSPGTGRVSKILFGPRRRLIEVIIELEKKEEFISFTKISRSNIDNTSKEKLVSLLKKGGLWQGFRQFPARDNADPGHIPPMIIVSLDGNDLFSPRPGVVLKDMVQEFEFGLEIMGLFSQRIVVTSRQSHLDLLGDLKNFVTHTVPDHYPAWDPGVVLYHLKKTPSENTSWCISVDHLILMAGFLLKGRYPTQRVVTITGAQNNNSHVLTRQGVPVNLIVNNVNDQTLLTTGQFNGRELNCDSHLGFFENTVNVIKDLPEDKMFGFMKPGFDSPTVSGTFLSALTKTPREMDCTIHGEERSCINCSYCENICPVDLMPNHIMKALYSDDIEEALELGLLDCCKCGLCSYACPSKIELTDILSQGIYTYHKDKI